MQIPVAVFTEPNGKSVGELLAPYDYRLKVPKYVLYTKEELIRLARNNNEFYREKSYVAYLADPEGYSAK